MRDEDDEDDQRDDAEQHFLRECQLNVAWSTIPRQIRHACDLHIRIGGNGLRDPRSHQRERDAVIVLAQDWRHLTLEAADLAIRQYWLEPVTYFHPVSAVLHGK